MMKVTNSMHAPIFRTFFVGLIMILAASACSSMSSSDDNSELWSPFADQSAWDVGDGRIRVEVSGYERGHAPGRAAEFTIEVENRRDTDAELDVCAKLIDEHTVVQEFNQEHLQIGAQESRSAVIDATLHEDVEPGAYGFAVVIDDIGVIVHTIRVGIPDDEPAQWLDVDELVCD
jgi:hypothetical protein